MNVSSLAFIDATGYHCADYPTFLQWVQDQYRQVYGADVYLGADSMDGQWTAILAQALYDTAQTGQVNYNSFSPASAQGVGLSRLVKINGLRREIASYSSVTLTIVGTAGTLITNGIASDSLNQQWLLPASVTIPGGGSINVTATAQNIGAINAAANTITTIFTPTLGWQTVNNAAAATPGAPVEQDGQLRQRQAVSTALPAQTVIDATVAALSNLLGVSKVASYENATGTTDGNGLPGHSVCFVLVGGDINAITNIIGLYKTPGTSTYATGPNAQNETYYDAKGMPVPINFIQPATTATITIEITIAANASWNDSFETQISDAVADFINAYGIGALIVYTELFGLIYASSPLVGAFTISLIRMKKNSGSLSASNIQLVFDEYPVCDPTVNVTWIVT